MANGFDLEYCREIAKEKTKQNASLRKSETSKRIKRGNNMCLFDTKLNKPVEFSVVGGQIINGTATQRAEQLLENGIRIASHNEAPLRNAVLDIILTDFETVIAADGYLYMVCQTTAGVKFNYSPHNVADYMMKELRDAVRGILETTHAKTDAYPKWFGEKTRKEERESCTTHHANSPFKLPLGGNISTTNIKAPITFKTVPKIIWRDNDNFDMFFETLAYYAIDGKQFIISSDTFAATNRPANKKISLAEAQTRADAMIEEQNAKNLVTGQTQRRTVGGTRQIRPPKFKGIQLKKRA